MVRTHVFLTRKQRDALDALAKATGRTRSDLLREAIDRLTDDLNKRQRRAALSGAVGLWKDRDDLPDFGRLRREWDRR